MAIDVYQIVTDRIIGLLETNIVPWRQPWAGGKAHQPRNLLTGKPYRRVNVFLLAVTAWQQGYRRLLGLLDAHVDALIDVLTVGCVSPTCIARRSWWGCWPATWA